MRLSSAVLTSQARSSRMSSTGWPAASVPCQRTTWPQLRMTLGRMKRSWSNQSLVAFRRCRAAFSDAARSSGLVGDR